ncbi:integrase [Gossypium australe]|uniref:Integrase n=1 Tax=Gossypium australe TaxID=47621 RepID=A0A5B6WV89_9ROSI|nr:integrase [Gossypium australe]
MAEHQLPSGLLQLWKWERTTMDFFSGLPLTPTKKDSVWVINDRLTKSVHFLPIRIDYSLQRLAKLYVSEIVMLHNKLHEALGARLDFSTVYHPQSDGIQMAPYKAMYGQKCCTPLCWTELGERWVLVPEVVSGIENTIKLI